MNGTRAHTKSWHHFDDSQTSTSSFCLTCEPMAVTKCNHKIANNVPISYYYHENEQQLDYEFESKELLIEAIRDLDLKIKANAAAIDVYKRKHVEAVSQRKRVNQQIVDANQRKKWCVHCAEEATIDCCFVGRYCSTTCLREIWPQHKNHCSQATKNAGSQSTITAIAVAVSNKTV